MDPWSQFPDAEPNQNAADPWAQFPDAETAAPQDPGFTHRAAPLPPDPRTWMGAIMDGADYLAGVGAYGAEGGRKGMSALLGAPVDLVNNAPRALNLLPGIDGMTKMSDKPFLGSDSIDYALRGFGLVPELPSAQDIPQSLANRIGYELGAASVPVGSALTAGARLGVEGARELGPIARYFVEPAAVAPTKFVGREAANAAAAGAGAGAANLAANNPQIGDNFWSDFFGSLAGSLGYGAGRSLLGATKNLAAGATGNPKFLDEVVGQSVADRVINNSTLMAEQAAKGSADASPLIDQLRRKAPVEDAIPGYQANIGDRTQDPQMMTFTQNVDTLSPGAANMRRTGNEAAIDARIAGLDPGGNAGGFREQLQTGVDTKIGSAEAQATEAARAAEAARGGIQPTMTPQTGGAYIRDAVDQALVDYVKKVEEEQALAAGKAAAAKEGLAPTQDPAVRGNTIRTALEDSRSAARDRTAEAYGKVGINDVQADPEALAGSLGSVKDGLTQVEQSLVPQGLIDRVAALGKPKTSVGPDGKTVELPPDPINLKEATSLKSQLQHLQSAALADPNAERGGRNAARVIGEYIDTVDRFINSSITPDQAAALEKARGAAFDEKQAFTRANDPVAAVLARQEGNPRIRDEAVAGQFVQPGQNTRLDRLLQEADTPEVRAAIEDEIKGRMTAPTRENADRLRTFADAYDVPLRNFPGLREQILGASAAQDAATAATAAVGAKRNEFNMGSRAMADTTTKRADGTPMLADEKVPGRFVNPAGNKDLEALFARADTPQVRAALENEIMGRVSSAKTPEALRQQVTQFSEPLKKFPGLEQKLLDAADTMAIDRFARGIADDTRTNLTTAGRSPEASYLSKGPDLPVESVRTVINAADPRAAAKQLVETAGGSADALRNARSAFWEVVKTKKFRAPGMTGGERWDPKALKAVFDDPRNAAVAEELWKDAPEELADIKKVFDALSTAEGSIRARAPGSSGTPQALNSKYDASLSAASVASRVRSVQRGVLSIHVALIDIGATWLRRKTAASQARGIDELTSAVVNNPGLAADLLERFNPADYAAKRRQIMQKFGVRATQVLNLLDEAMDEEQSTKDAVMEGAK